MFSIYRNLMGIAVGLGSATLASAPLSAETVDINVAATLKGDCSIRGTSLKLDIGDVFMTDLASAGDTTSWAQGKLISDGCQGVSNVSMQFDGVASTDPGYTDLFAPSDATGVAIELQASDDGSTYSPVKPNAAMDFAPKASGQGWDFQARLVRTVGTYTSGDANATIRVTVTYS